jgi:hypothetical protein
VKKLTFLIFSFVALSTVAQQWQWDTLIPVNVSLRLEKNKAGDIFEFNSPNKLRRFDKYENFYWEKQIAGQILNAAVDSLCNSYLIGVFSGTITQDGFTITSVDSNDIFLMKLDKNGNVIWLNQIGSTGNEGGGDVCVLQNKLVVTGVTQDTTWFGSLRVPKEAYRDMFVAMYDLNGNLVKNRFSTQAPQDPSSGASGQEIKTDGKNIFVLASVLGGFRWDTTYFCGGYSGVVMKMDTALNLLWNSTISSGLYSGWYDFDVDVKGKSYVITESYGHYSTSPDWFCLKSLSDSDGKIDTILTVPDIRLICLAPDENGNVFFCSRQYSPDLTEIQKADSNGVISILFSDTAKNFLGLNEICVVDPNSFFVSGTFIKKIFLHDTLYGPQTQAQTFLAVLNPGNTTAIDNLKDPAATIHVFPNPSNGTFFISSKENCKALVSIRDIIGTTVYRGYLEPDISTMNLSELPKGIYLMEVAANNGKTVKRLVIQ